MVLSLRAFLCMFLSCFLTFLGNVLPLSCSRPVMPFPAWFMSGHVVDLPSSCSGCCPCLASGLPAYCNRFASSKVRDCHGMALVCPFIASPAIAAFLSCLVCAFASDDLSRDVPFLVFDVRGLPVHVPPAPLRSPCPACHAFPSVLTFYFSVLSLSCNCPSHCHGMAIHVPCSASWPVFRCRACIVIVMCPCVSCAALALHAPRMSLSLPVICRCACNVRALLPFHPCYVSGPALALSCP